MNDQRMTDDRSKMRDGDMPLLDRIESAMRRVTSGQGQMRVPVEATDTDIVLFDCKREIKRLREALTEANAQAEHFEREWYLRGDEIERLRSGRNELEAAISNALPGVRYMDPPDGGSPSLAEQLRRMATDAERYLWLRDALDNEQITHGLHEAFQLGADALDAAIDAARKEEWK